MAPHLASPQHLAAGEQSVKLGGVCPVSRPEAFRFAVYFNAATKAQSPALMEYAAKASASLQRMYLSDRYRNTLIVGQYHAKAIWSAIDNGPAGIVSGMDVEVFNEYQTICVPGDMGRLVTPVLDYFETKGFLSME